MRNGDDANNQGKKLLKPAEVARLIHAAEFLNTKKAKTKRLESIVTDFFFEEFITQQNSLGISDTHSSGWMTCFDTKRDIRKWYKLSSEEGSDARNLCLLFIRKILSLGKKNEFYLINYKVLPTGKPEYVLKQLKLDPTSNKIGSTSRKDLDLLINRSISSKFTPEKIPLCINLYAIEPWLIGGRFSPEQLNRILALRVFLNFSGIFGLTDIDLVCWIDGQISIIEFKRKYPANGYRYVFDFPPKNYSSILSSFPTNAIALCTYREESKQPGAYGLDESHLKILSDIHTGITYRNVIWDSKTTELSKLLTCDLSLISPATIKYLDLRLSLLHGLTSTPPLLSSSFNSTHSRSQILILESGYISFVIP